MLDTTITDSSPATECDRCDTEYREKNGCSLGRTSTEIMACQIERAKYRESGHM